MSKKEIDKGLSEEDKKLWSKVASTVKRYPVKNKDSALSSSASSFRALFEKEGKKPNPPHKIQKTEKESQQERPRIHSGVDGNTLSRLKKGQLPIEAVLDLHGLTLEKAHQRCLVFLKTAQKRGNHCVLVITGKGRFSKEGEGVLKKNFPEWLHESPLDKIVLSFASARVKDGGSGAFYVLLRKIKEG